MIFAMANIDLFNLNISGKKQLKEIVSPHKIALLVLIKEFCLMKNKCRSQPSNALEDSNSEIWSYTKQQMRDFAINTLRLIQSPDIQLKCLVEIAKKILQQKLFETFKDKLKEINNQGIAALKDYITSLEVLMVDPKHPIPVVHKSSVIGLFLRRMLLAFDKLTFSQVTKLHHNYQTYFEAAFQEPDSSMSDTQISDLTLSKNISILDDSFQSEHSQGIASHRQAELFIAQQAALIQTNEKEALPPVELQKHIQDLLKANSDLAEAHYLSYLNCLRIMEYCGAVHNLYHSFDCNTSANHDNKTSTNTEEVGRSFRYAALNLAALHCRFGHREEALAALREAITMAQDANDNVCLQHCLSWLYRLDGEQREVLVERSITKTGDLSLSYLTSLGVQAFTQHKSIHNTQPSLVFEFMMKSDILNCQHSMLELMANSYAQKAALWNMYGKSCMSSLSSQLLLQLNTSDPARRGLYHCGEGICLAVRNMVLFLAREGHIRNSMEVLNHIKQLYPNHNPHCHIWMLVEHIIIYDRAIQQGNWQKAESAVQTLAVINSEEAKLRQAQLMLYRGDTAQASQLISKLTEEYHQSGNTKPEFFARILILQAEVHCLSTNYSTAISPLTQCLSVCHQHYLDYMASLVMLHIANVQLLLELPEQAMSLLNQGMVSIFAHGSVYDRARAQLLYAKCTITIAMKTNCSNKREALLSATRMMSKAINDFSKIEANQRVKDALHLQAVLYNELGFKDERNRCALKFRQLDQQPVTAAQPHFELL